MERRTLGQTGMEVSVLGFGGAEIGFEGASRETVERLLGAALDAGLNVIDTAECYVDSEEKIGQTVSHRRGEFHLFTKGGHPQEITTGDWSKASLLATLERSLSRLKTSHVDLYLLHSCSEKTLRAGEVIEACREAKERGLTRFIGYSGDSQAARFAIESGAFDVLETSVSIADQEALDLTLPLARERGMGVIAKRPIANAAWRTGQRPASDYHVPYWERLGELKYDFLTRPLPEAVGIALRFTLSVPGVHTAIVGTTRPERWQENARLLDAGPLPSAEFDAIRNRWREVAAENWVGQI